MIVKYLGHSSFIVEFPNRRVLFDPWFQNDPTRLVKSAFTADQIGKVDMIFVTHEHYDHFSAADIIPVQSKSFAQVVAPEQVLAQLDVPSRYKVPVRAGDDFSLLGVDVKVIEAKHPQSTNPVSFLVSSGGKSVFFAGDTYDHYGLNQIEADVAFIPIGGTYTMDVFNAVTAVKKMRAKFVVPMHYDTLKGIQADPNDFAKRVKSARITPIVLEPGQQAQV
jgi:L-ascorbate metabolism protein UlaG (beta-lactamase superfamily)